MALGDFAVGLGEKIGGPMVSMLMQRFIGTSTEARKETKKFRTQNQQNIELSRQAGGEEHGDELVANYEYYRDQLDKAKRKQLVVRETIAKAIRLGDGKVKPEGPEVATSPSPEEKKEGEEPIKGEAPTEKPEIANPQNLPVPVIEGKGLGIIAPTVAGGSEKKTFAGGLLLEAPAPSVPAEAKEDAYGNPDATASDAAKYPAKYVVGALAVVHTLNALLGKEGGEKKKMAEGGGGGGGIGGIISKGLGLVGKMGGLLTKVVGSKAFATIFGKGAKFLGNAGAMAAVGAKGAAKIAGRAAFPVALLTEALMTTKKIIDINKDQKLTSKEKTVKKAGAIGSGLGGLGGAVGGAALGAAIGSVVPGLGTLIGGAVGGVIGGILGNKAGDAAGQAVGKAIVSKAPAKVAVPPKFHDGGVVTGPKDEVDATLKRGEVVLPTSIAPIYKDIAANTASSAGFLKKELTQHLQTIEETLNDIKTKMSSTGFPGATSLGGIGSK